MFEGSFCRVEVHMVSVRKGFPLNAWGRLHYVIVVLPGTSNE